MHPTETTNTGWFRKIYGSAPSHLLVLSGCFLLAGYTLLVLGPAKLFNPDVWWQSIIVWFLGGAVLLDLVLLPLFATANRALKVLLTAGTKTGVFARKVPVVNYIRIPVLASGLLFLLFFPGIIQQGSGSYMAATGQTQEPFLERWLWLSALFCVASAIMYVLRSVTVHAKTAEPPETKSTTTDSTERELRD